MNENPVCSNLCGSNELQDVPLAEAAFWQRASDTNCQQLLSRPDNPAYLVAAWPLLSPHVREAIVTLADADVARKRGV
ncbi:MAG: hypothetical protein AB7O38_24130 [Pirellulaceae bacterium]